MAPSKDRPPLQDAEGISPPLQLESILPPEGGSCSTWANHQVFLVFVSNSEESYN